MARFKFQLQSFLNLKRQMEKNVKNELGIAVQQTIPAKGAVRSGRKLIVSRRNSEKKECGNHTLKTYNG